MSGVGKVYSVNVGKPREVEFFGKVVSTAIFKESVSGAVTARHLGLEGDKQADLTVHGGPQKAVYFYPREHYAMWEKLLGIGPLAPGAFGENITSEGFSEADLCIGDVIQIGSTLLQVLQPRSPCYKLQIKFQRPDMVALFVHQNRPGWYASVVQEGSLTAGDEITIVSRAPEQISVADIWRYSLVEDADLETQQRVRALELLPGFWKKQILRSEFSSAM
ncbi:MOSC domain-containing protein [Terriglobus albidus]|uniref:MOSC domain-containing protein n=1 Tax=Terriglobus albidus TaxID=1592106 RepID=UPI00164D0F0B|nr:MOSC domain-containing protein [Terriglobus albidus]